MEKIKYIFLLICILAFGSLIEFVRVEYKIPVTLLDAIFFPASIILTFGFLRMLASRRDEKYNNSQTTVKRSLINFLILTLIIVPLSCSAMWSGISAPLEYFSGVKGSGHGYTLVAVGILLLTIWGGVFWDLYKQITFKKTNNK